MTEPYLGMVINAAFSFAPRGYATCDGQIIPLQQNTALYALLGVTYGGNGSSNFALPDLRGQVVLSRGQSAGTSSYVQGQRQGVENVTMLSSNLPAHNHPASFTPTANLSANNVDGTSPAPDVGYQLARAIDGDTMPDAQPNIYGPATAGQDVTLTGPVNIAGNISLAANGSSTPFTTINPYTTIISIICTSGVFPSRN